MSNDYDEDDYAEDDYDENNQSEYSVLLMTVFDAALLALMPYVYSQFANNYTNIMIYLFFFGVVLFPFGGFVLLLMYLALRDNSSLIFHALIAIYIIFIFWRVVFPLCLFALSRVSNDKNDINRADDAVVGGIPSFLLRFFLVVLIIVAFFLSGAA